MNAERGESERLRKLKLVFLHLLCVLFGAFFCHPQCVFGRLPARVRCAASNHDQAKIPEACAIKINFGNIYAFAYVHIDD